MTTFDSYDAALEAGLAAMGLPAGPRSPMGYDDVPGLLIFDNNGEGYTWELEPDAITRDTGLEVHRGAVQVFSRIGTFGAWASMALDSGLPAAQVREVHLQLHLNGEAQVGGGLMLVLEG